MMGLVPLEEETSQLSLCLPREEVQSANQEGSPHQKRPLPDLGILDIEPLEL